MNMGQFVIPRHCEIPEGAYGVWQIPELEITIPVYIPKHNTYTEGLAIVDADNSATYRICGVGHIIEDHANSQAGRGTWQIGKVHPDTLGFLITAQKTEKYVCNRVVRAQRHTNCFTVDGVGFWPRSATDILCMGCATEDAKEVYIAAFKFKGVMP